jgi:hypothetical protein
MALESMMWSLGGTLPENLEGDKQEYAKIQLEEFKKSEIERWERKIDSEIGDKIGGYKIKLIEYISISSDQKVTKCNESDENSITVVYLEDSPESYFNSVYPNVIFISTLHKDIHIESTIFHELAHLKGGINSRFISISGEDKVLYLIYGFRETVYKEDTTQYGVLLEEWWAMTHQNIVDLTTHVELYVTTFQVIESIVQKLETISTDQINQIFTKYNYSEQYKNSFTNKWNTQNKRNLLLEIFGNARYTFTDRMVMRDLFNALQDGLFEKIFNAQMDLIDIKLLKKIVDKI